MECHEVRRYQWVGGCVSTLEGGDGEPMGIHVSRVSECHVGRRLLKTPSPITGSGSTVRAVGARRQDVPTSVVSPRSRRVHAPSGPGPLPLVCRVEWDRPRVSLLATESVPGVRLPGPGSVLLFPWPHSVSSVHTPTSGFLGCRSDRSGRVVQKTSTLPGTIVSPFSPSGPGWVWRVRGDVVGCLFWIADKTFLSFKSDPSRSLGLVSFWSFQT